MGLEPASIDLVKKISKHYGLVPIRIRGTSQVNICKHMNPKKYDVITWDEFEQTLAEKKLEVYKDSSSSFLKIMRAGAKRK